MKKKQSEKKAFVNLKYDRNIQKYKEINRGRI